MLSGVGPQNELNKHNIPVLQSLKVGYNLIDHPTFVGLNFLINTTDALTLDELNSEGIANHYHFVLCTTEKYCLFVSSSFQNVLYFVKFSYYVFRSEMMAQYNGSAYVPTEGTL